MAPKTRKTNATKSHMEAQEVQVTTSGEGAAAKPHDVQKVKYGEGLSKESKSKAGPATSGVMTRSQTNNRYRELIADFWQKLKQEDMAGQQTEIGTHIRIFYPESLIALRIYMNAVYRIGKCIAELENLQKDQQRIRSVCRQPDGQQHDVYTDHGQELAGLSDRVNELETLRDQKLEEAGILFPRLVSSEVISVEKVFDMKFIVEELQPAGFNGPIRIADTGMIAESERCEIQRLCDASNITIVQN